MPPGVVDRPADVGEAFLSIAQSLGADWAGRAADACSHFALAPRDVTASLSLALLADLKDVIAAHGHPDALPTSTLLEGLCSATR